MPDSHREGVGINATGIWGESECFIPGEICWLVISYLNFDAIEKGLNLLGRQMGTDLGRIDILAEDSKGLRVVIEVKVGHAKDSPVGQIFRYLRWYAKTEGKATARLPDCRGLLRRRSICPSCDPKSYADCVPGALFVRTSCGVMGEEMRPNQPIQWRLLKLRFAPPWPDR
jgi:hypothetical protein